LNIQNSDGCYDSCQLAMVAFWVFYCERSEQFLG
jgi:hypothetical protein